MDVAGHDGLITLLQAERIGACLARRLARRFSGERRWAIALLGALEDTMAEEIAAIGVTAATPSDADIQAAEAAFSPLGWSGLLAAIADEACHALPQLRHLAADPDQEVAAVGTRLLAHDLALVEYARLDALGRSLDAMSVILALLSPERRRALLAHRAQIVSSDPAAMLPDRV